MPDQPDGSDTVSGSGSGSGDGSTSTSFWRTTTGLITALGGGGGIAALITAAVVLLGVFDNGGNDEEQPPTPTPAPPLLVVNTGFIDYGDVEVGTTSREFARIENAGEAALTVTDVALEDGGAQHFRVIDSACRGRTLVGGQSCSIEVIAEPSSAETGTTNVRIVTDAGDAFVSARVVGVNAPPPEPEPAPDIVFLVFDVPGFTSFTAATAKPSATIEVLNDGTAPATQCALAFEGGQTALFGLAEGQRRTFTVNGTLNYEPGTHPVTATVTCSNHSAEDTATFSFRRFNLLPVTVFPTFQARP